MVLKVITLHVLLVARGTMGNVIGYREFFFYGKDGYKVRDCPCIYSREMEVRKFLQLFRVMVLQIRISSVHSELEYQRRM